MTNKIEISWKGQMLFESVAPEGSVMIDAAEEVGVLRRDVHLNETDDDGLHGR